MGDPLPDEDPVMVRSDVLAVPLDDSLVLYDPAAGRAHVLNRSAGHIWGALRVPTTIDEARGRPGRGNGHQCERRLVEPTFER